MQITWLGHASFKIKLRNKTIYIDPYSGEYDEKADIILVSHAHYDHFSQETISKVRNDDTIILTIPGVASQINGAETISEGAAKDIGEIKITAIPMYSPTHPRGAGIGFLIQATGKSIYFAGDAGLMQEFQNIKADIALLPVGGTYTMNAKEAAEAVKMMKPKIAIPMHFGSIVGSIDDAENFKELVEEQTETKVNILNQGESFEV